MIYENKDETGGLLVTLFAITFGLGILVGKFHGPWAPPEVTVEQAEARLDQVCARYGWKHFWHCEPIEVPTEPQLPDGHSESYDD